MVHGFSKQSNGAMVIESKIGDGSRVTLYFPAKATEEGTKESIEESYSSNHHTRQMDFGNVKISCAHKPLRKQTCYHCPHY